MQSNADFIDGTLFAANWENCILAATIPLPLPIFPGSVLSILCHGLFYLFSPSPPFPAPIPVLLFPAETIRAIARKHIVITASRNWLIMRGWISARKRELFSVALAASTFISSAFFKAPSRPPLRRKPDRRRPIVLSRDLSSPDLLYPRLFFGWVRDRLIFFHFQCETKLFTKNISVLLALTLLYDIWQEIWQVLFIYQIHSGILLALHSSNLMYPKEIHQVWRIFISPILFALFIYHIYLSDISFCVTKIVNAAVLFGLKSCVWEVQTASIIFVIFRRGRKEREGRRDVDKARWEAVPRKCA